MSSVTYTVAIITAKASLAALYLTVFRRRSCLLHTLNRGLLLFFLCQAVEETAVVMSRCLPAIWSWSSTGPGICVNLKPFWWTTVRRIPRFDLRSNYLLDHVNDLLILSETNPVCLLYGYQHPPLLPTTAVPVVQASVVIRPDYVGRNCNRRHPVRAHLPLDPPTRNANKRIKDMRHLAPPSSRCGQDWDGYYMYVESVPRSRGDKWLPCIPSVFSESHRTASNPQQTTTHCHTSGLKSTSVSYCFSRVSCRSGKFCTHQQRQMR